MSIRGYTVRGQNHTHRYTYANQCSTVQYARAQALSSSIMFEIEFYFKMSEMYRTTTATELFKPTPAVTQQIFLTATPSRSSVSVMRRCTISDLRQSLPVIRIKILVYEV